MRRLAESASAARASRSASSDQPGIRPVVDHVHVALDSGACSRTGCRKHRPQQEGAPGVQTGLPQAGPSRPLYEWVGLLLLVAGIVLVGIAQDAIATPDVGQSDGVVAVDVDVAAQVRRRRVAGSEHGRGRRCSPVLARLCPAAAVNCTALTTPGWKTPSAPWDWS